MNVSDSAISALRVLHVITGTTEGGAETMLLNLLKGTDASCFQSKVISLGPKECMGEEYEAAGVDIRYLNASSSLKMPAVFPGLVKEIRGFRPHVIQGWMYHGNIAASAGCLFAMSPAAVLWNVRHSLEDMGKEKRLTTAVIRLGSFFSSRVKRVVYNASSSARQHQAIGYSRDNAVIIPNGFDTGRFRPSAAVRKSARSLARAGDENLLVGMVARYHPVKGHGDFLNAAAACSRLIPGMKFMLAGEGIDNSNGELTRRIRELGLEDSFTLLGHRNDLERLYPGLDLLVLSSLSESFPNVLGEAMSCGVACVCTDVGDCREIIGDTGIAVPPGRSDLLAKAIVELMSAPGYIRLKRGAGARDRIRKIFSLQSVVDRYEALYRTAWEECSDHPCALPEQRAYIGSRQS